MILSALIMIISALRMIISGLRMMISRLGKGGGGGKTANFSLETGSGGLF
jgi:hypothetical protein